MTKRCQRLSAVLIALCACTDAAFGFQERDVGDRSGGLPSALQLPGLDVRLPQSGPSAGAGTEIRVPGVGSVGTLPKLDRSEEHTSELQSLRHLVCRLLL